MYKSATRCAGARNLRIPYAGDREHAYGVPRSRFPGGRSLDLAVTWQPLVPMLDFADAPKQVRAYVRGRTFSKDEWFEYSTFGLGRVLSELEGRKIEVVFAERMVKKLALF